VKNLRYLVLLCALVFAGGFASTALAEEATQFKDLALREDARCTSCHDETDSPKVLRIGKSKHGTQADAATPASCASCHGQSDAHVKEANAGATRPAKPDLTYGKSGKSTPEARNEACLACHQADPRRTFWAGSQHQNHDLACTSCHEIHTGHDAVRDKLTQAEVCYTCHKEQRAQANKNSHHPIAEGKMACSDCHNAHGTTGEKLLAKDTVNDTCYQCHAEKRGPVIYAHQPVADNCMNCHNPHGTNADSMLKIRPPFLCLGCHDPSSHPGNVPGLAGQVDMSKNSSGQVLGATTPFDNNNSSGVVGKTQGTSCMNCHTDIHGSNNPMDSTRSLRYWR
jgi:DmsE family decaheme c-type cytochrome